MRQLGTLHQYQTEMRQLGTLYQYQTEHRGDI